jgi:signal transduction histidine kinase
MSRSLTVKLTLAFLVVGLTGAVLVALFVGHRTRREFDRFVLDQGQAQLVASLADYYRSSGSWAGLGRAGRPDFGPWPSRWPVRDRAILADASGTVIVGPRGALPGSALSDSDRARAVPLAVDGETVGYLLLTGPRGVARPLAALEASFLARVNRAILLGAVGATGVAMLLGLLLAGTITRPLRALTAATQAVARGELGHQVRLESRDELGELAGSFNRMSADLARASLLRRQMTADIAHDLRTPLTVLLGYTEGLADGKYAGTAEIYGRMHQQALQLRHLIEDLRILSLADAGELGLARRPTPPHLLLERVAAAQAPLAEAKGVRLTVQGDTDLPPMALDVERVTQVLDNLVGNALRHTPPGGEITLSAEPAPGALLLRVADTGEGIAPEALPYIFERHYRGDPARSPQDGGSGLGLAIARSLVEAHGGSITVESTPGAGSEFIISLPCQAA